MNRHSKPAKARQLNLKDAETYELAAKLSALHGETLSGTVKTALREKLERDTGEATRQQKLARLTALTGWYASLPDKDTRTADEILGYDENGLPT
jgi:antitoxin VapB